MKVGGIRSRFIITYKGYLLTTKGWSYGKYLINTEGVWGLLFKYTT